MWKQLVLIAMGWSFSLSSKVVEPAPYNWTQNIINAPSKKQTQEGHQVLHIQSTDNPYEESPEAVAFVSQHLQGAQAFLTDSDLLRFASDQVSQPGVYLELGVVTGKMTNFIAALNPQKILYGFDSFFVDLEPYEKGGHKYPKATFGLKDHSKLPPLLGNVKLIQGPFVESLPYFIDHYLKDQSIAFLHVDSELYRATKESLDILAPYIKSGTVIVFDEFYHYDAYEQFEWKAFNEFLEQTGYRAKYIGYNTMSQGVAVVIEN